MSKDDFEKRLSRLGQAQAVHVEKPGPRKAQNRKERLATALMHLERGGVTGALAYPPAFRALARIGIIVKPPFYQSWFSLVVLPMILLTGIAAFTIVASFVLGVLPSPVRGMITAGPQVFFIGVTVISMGLAGFHKWKAREIGLPRWRDI